ncbi:uncharacterized protein LOC114247201 [Bombyx mandarina]|uniref:Uncharacterized protein LOC114247201 n=1 Tax=Bombyx mandarina TaxID=7092 RepID=A0A6J2K6I8_BOMMA|nr:uncharacterized protein LOC114247201 [Bombyx mandarina]
MYAKIVVISVALLQLASIVESNDIRLGIIDTPRSRKIYSEIVEAVPGLSKRRPNIKINAPHSGLITAVYITDLREYKDGEAFITSGGVGQKSVTIGLKTPTILRGYKFQIEVYATDPNAG